MASILNFIIRISSTHISLPFPLIIQFMSGIVVNFLMRYTVNKYINTVVLLSGTLE